MRPDKTHPCCENCYHWVFTLDDFTKISECLAGPFKGKKTKADHHCEGWKYSQPWTKETYEKAFGIPWPGGKS